MGSTTWRVVGIGTEGHDLSVFSLRLLDDTGAVDSGSTITSSHLVNAGSLSNLADDTAGATCQFAAKDVATPGFYIQWVLPTAKTVTGLRIGRTTGAGAFPLRVSVQHLKDGQWVAASDTGKLPMPAPGAASTVRFDPYWPSVVLLLRGATGAGVEDKSPLGSALTLFGTTTASSSPIKFGPRAIRFGTTASGNYVRLLNPSALAFGSKDFTFEAQCYFSSGSGALQQLIYHNYLSTFATNAIFFGRHGDFGGRVVFWAANTGVETPTLLDPNPPTENVYVHYAVCRKGGVLTLLRDGEVVATAAVSGALTNDTTVVGGYVSTNIGSFVGSMEDVRVTIGVARYADGEPAPSYATPPSLITLADPLPVKTLRPNVAVLGTEPPAQTLGPFVSLEVGVFDNLEFAGNGRVYGTVERKNTPANVPMRRRVRLHRSRDGLLVRETWSKADGTYEFNGISMQYEYDTIAWDNEMSYRSVVANNLKPEAM